MIETYTADATNPPEFPEIEFSTFYNDYPEFEDTNNLSLVTFLHYKDAHIIFPGDLEKPGWNALLQSQSFQEHLKRTNIFIASHHGRQSGYCPDVFDYCLPEIVIISDDHIQYETQETEYSSHAKGISWGKGRRYVLTTRKDGMITISQRPGERPAVSTAK